MKVKSVTLKNFRNYADETVTFADGLNVIIGQNASGKTNLMESLYCCGIGKSPRTPRYKELVRWGEEFAYIKVVVARAYRDYTVELSVDVREKKRIAVDGVPLAKLSELLGILDVVYFSPDEMKLIKESPQERRRFMDISLSQQSKIYYHALSRYNAILTQRNKLLKTENRADKLREMLAAWDEQFIGQGVYLMKKRYEFVTRLREYARQAHADLTDGAETLELAYESEIEDLPLAEMKDRFADKLGGALEKDIKLQYTSVGVHRDDIAIKSNGVDVRKFGSQGQQRTSVLALKLAEVRLFRESGESPVLLLDDVLSELDAARRDKLTAASADLQCFITCTDFDMAMPRRELRVENGKIVSAADFSAK